MSANAAFKQLLDGINEIQQQQAQEAKISSAIQGVTDNPNSLSAILNLMQAAPEAGKGFLALQQQSLQQQMKAQEQAAQQQQALAQDIKHMKRANKAADALENYIIEEGGVDSMGRGFKDFKITTPGWHEFNSKVRPALIRVMNEAEAQGNKPLVDVLKHQLENLEKQDESAARQLPELLNIIREYAQDKQQEIEAAMNNPLLTPEQIQIQQYLSERDNVKKSYANANPLGGLSSNMADMRKEIARSVQTQPAEEAAVEPVKEEAQPKQEPAPQPVEEQKPEQKKAEQPKKKEPKLSDDQKIIQQKDLIMQLLNEGRLTSIHEKDGVSLKDYKSGKQLARSGLNLAEGAATAGTILAAGVGTGGLGTVALAGAEGLSAAGSFAQGVEMRNLFKNREAKEKITPYFMEKLNISEKEVKKLMNTKEGQMLLGATFREGRRAGEFGTWGKIKTKTASGLASIPTVSKGMAKGSDAIADKYLQGTKRDERAVLAGNLIASPVKGIVRGAGSNLGKAAKVGALATGTTAGLGALEKVKEPVKDVIGGAAEKVGISRDTTDLAVELGSIAGAAYLATKGGKALSKAGVKGMQYNETKLAGNIVKNAQREYAAKLQQVEGDVLHANKVSVLDRTAKNINDISMKYGIEENPLIMSIDRDVAKNMSRGGQGKQWNVPNHEFTAAEELAKNNVTKILKTSMTQEGDVGGIKGMSNRQADLYTQDLYKNIDKYADRMLSLDKQNVGVFRDGAKEIFNKDFFLEGFGAMEDLTDIGRKGVRTFKPILKEFGIDASGSDGLNFELWKDAKPRDLKMKDFLATNKKLNNLRGLCSETLKNPSSSPVQKEQARSIVKATNDLQKLLRDSFVPEDMSIELQRADRAYAQLQNRLLVQDMISDINKNGIEQVSKYAKGDMTDLLSDFGATKMKSTALADGVKDAILYGDHFNFNNQNAVNIVKHQPIENIINVFQSTKKIIRNKAIKETAKFSRRVLGENPYSNYKTQAFGEGKLLSFDEYGWRDYSKTAARSMPKTNREREMRERLQRSQSRKKRVR